MQRNTSPVSSVAEKKQRPRLTVAQNDCRRDGTATEKNLHFLPNCGRPGGAVGEARVSCSLTLLFRAPTSSFPLFPCPPPPPPPLVESSFLSVLTSRSKDSVYHSSCPINCPFSSPLLFRGIGVQD
ncbi:hypothetical protein KSP40_PGU018223 [Platanthera guangdongensis]|uniref:Uncharacterized protein n=1 Tax=Platanthera guangdongensis TaxID=2320717 RepID=A0ABR2MTP9_9ASPA